MIFKTFKTSALLMFLFTAAISPQDISSGIKLVKYEKYSEAKKYFSSLLNSDKKTEMLFNIGQIYELENKYDSAKDCYLNGITADDEFPLNYAAMVKICLIEKNTSGADKYKKQAIESGDEKNSMVYVILSNAYSMPEIKDYDQALLWLKNALKINPKNAEAYIALGKIYLLKGDGTEAIKNFESALAINPGDPEALTQKAKVYSLINKYSEADNILNEALKNDPDYPPAYCELAELSATIKDYSKASDYYARYIEKSESAPGKLKRYASILYVNKDYGKTINILEDLIKQEKEISSSVRILAYSYLRNGDLENGNKYFQKLFSLPSIEFLPSDYENYADLLTKTDNDSLAIEYLKKVIAADTGRTDILSRISILSYKRKDWNGVIDALEKKGNLTGQEYFDLGKSYYFIQDYVKADTAFGSLIQKAPDLAIAYFWKARVKTNFDMESEMGLARPYYETFTERAENDRLKFRKELVEAYSYLGYYYYLQENNQKSKSFWEDVLSLDPENKQAIDAVKALK